MSPSEHPQNERVLWSGPVDGECCVALLRALIRIPTVNTGDTCHERPAAELLAEFFRAHRLEPVLLEPEPGRTSVVVRVRARKPSKAPLLLNAHLDVVEADASKWQHPPFAAEVHDGYVWGRGAIDMKHMAAMSACVMVLLAERGVEHLERDVVFAGVADEEAGCAKGSMFLVDEHPERVRAEYTLGEIGAFSQHVFGRTFYPIQIAEKGVVWLRAHVEGEPGHGSMPREDSAILALADVVTRLGRTRLPPRRSEAVTKFFDAMASELPLPVRQVLRSLPRSSLSNQALDLLVRDLSQRRTFRALLSNIAVPTVLRGGAKVNVIPGRASVDIDGRTLPGTDAHEAQLLAELRDLLGNAVRLEVLRSMPPVETSERTPLFAHLAHVLRQQDPAALPIPFVIPGFTDAKAYARLGSKCYGFSPVKLDAGVAFGAMYHGHDERVPIAGIHWGLRVLLDAVSGFAAPRALGTGGLDVGAPSG